MSLSKAHDHHDAFPKDEHITPAITFTIVAMWCFEFLLQSHNTLYQAEVF